MKHKKNTPKQSVNTPSTSTTTTTTTIDEQNEKKEFISDEKWDEYSSKVLAFLESYSSKLDIVGFLGQIKQKLDDCSRCYTGSWVIEMLYKTNDKHSDALGNEFAVQLRELKRIWDREIMDPIRQERQDFMCKKSFDLFYSSYPGANAIITREKAEKLEAFSFTHRWNQVCKMCADKGLLENEEYKAFLGKLMVEMVKY